MKELLINYLDRYIYVETGGLSTRSGTLDEVTDSYFKIGDYEDDYYYPFTAILEIKIGDKIVIKTIGAGIEDAVNSIPELIRF